MNRVSDPHTSHGKSFTTQDVFYGFPFLNQACVAATIAIGLFFMIIWAKVNFPIQEAQIVLSTIRPVHRLRLGVLCSIFLSR
jgi:hypothetical protein